ncbi:MAG: hypothetical protein SOZ83_01625 [Sphaerochaetaceae bacterium]|nr:hypothetical protein [Sphaerochaetaceae bacterium]
MNKVNINNVTPIKILAVTPIRDEFDLNGSIKAHFSLIKTHPSGRRAYLRTEKPSNITSIEVVQPVKKKHPVTGETYYAYPSSEQFGAFGVYISVRNEMKRNEITEFYLEHGFDVSYSQYQKEHNIK